MARIKGFRPYSDFTAHGKTVAALHSLYGHLEQGPTKHFELTPIVVFIAFSIESYLNSLGARHLDIWDELERLPWRSKVEILHKTAKKELDWGSAHLQFAAEIFKLRDKLAHGKPERVEGPLKKTQKESDGMLYDIHTLQPDWYRGITKQWVLEAKERFRQLMIYLGGLFNHHESDHLHAASGGTEMVMEKDA